MEVVGSPRDQDGRLVHLDLKGAPPRISYFEKIFPLLHRWGATGLLIEYEDMFPYSGELKDLAAPNAYTESEIGQLLELAKKNNLSVIPLVQTFGHFEFVLKHEKYVSLREIKEFPMALCPTHGGALPLVTQMIEQVLNLHPTIQWFHIGADEVFHLGICEDCKRQMKVNNWTISRLFFAHIVEVLRNIQSKHPQLQLIMWDDMFRELDTDTLKMSGLGLLVEPMVWYYQKTFHLPEDIWDRYSKVFPNIWVASAFKGATGPCMTATDISYHIENHNGWLDIMRQQRHKFQSFRGIALTGWQRYDHYSVMCELLPVGLPSLAICLLTLTNGSFTEEILKLATMDLKFSDLIPINPLKMLGHLPQCEFPGSSIYTGVHIFLYHAEQVRLFMENDRLNGWMTDYHVSYRFGNPAHIQHFLPSAQQLHDELQRLRSDLQRVMAEVFYPDTVEEWITVNLNPRIAKLTEVISKATQQITFGARPKELDNRLIVRDPQDTSSLS